MKNLPELVLNELNQYHREGAEVFRFPALECIVYVHRETQEIFEQYAMGKKYAKNTRSSVPSKAFDKSVDEKLKHLEYKEKAAQAAIDEAQQLRDSCKVGDVFYSSWGSDQTNLSFYQVIEIKGQSVKFRPINSERKESQLPSGGSSMAGVIIPLVGDFDGDKVITKRFPKRGRIQMASYECIQPLPYTISETTGSRIYQQKRYSAYA